MTTIRYTHLVAGTPTDADTVTLQAYGGTHGVRRKDTAVTVVAGGTAMTKTATGVYEHTFSDPSPGLSYEYGVKAVLGTATNWVSGVIAGDTGWGTYTKDLAGIRRRLIEQSGHYELVADAHGLDFADRGANEFINAGQRWLDRLFDYHKSAAWIYKPLVSGESLVTFSSARYIKEIWIVENGVRRPLPRSTWQMLRDTYRQTDHSLTTPAPPQHWAPIPVGLGGNQSRYADGDDLDPLEVGVDGYNDIVFGDHWPVQGILIMPPPEAGSTLEVCAVWRQSDLVNDTDKTYWTVEAPELLTRAARWQIEIDLHRNRTGIADYEAALGGDLRRLYHSLVDEESSGSPGDFVMRG